MLKKDLFLSEDVFDANIEIASTRDGVGDALVELGQENENIVVLTADLTESTRVDKFAEKFPKRFIQVGIAEQNMMGIAAGLALSGKIPFVSSYAVFSPSQNWAQLRLAVCYTNADVKIIGGHTGFSASRDGATHQALEDIALTRTLPNLTVIAPADYHQAKKAIFEATLLESPVYIRVYKNETPKFTTEKTPFEIGKAQTLRDGTDVTLFTTGSLVYETLLAAQELKMKHRIDAEVINIHTIKPLDTQTIVNAARKTELVVSIEEHQVAGGLGSAIAETLSEKQPTKMLRIGVQDTFGESGKYEDLLEKYELNSEHICKKVKEFLYNAQ